MIKITEGIDMEQILLIEPDKNILQETGDFLQSKGYVVIGTGEGASGVEKTLEIQPDIILCNVDLPDIDGYEVLKKLQQNKSTATIPFVFLMKKASIKDIRKAMKMGADDCLIKPWSFEELSELIKTRIDKKQRIINDRSKKVHRQEQYLRTILQNTKDGFWIVNHKGKIIDVNKTYCQMTGFTRDEVLEMTIRDIDAIETDQDAIDRMERIKKNGSEIFETRLWRKDKTVFDVELSVTYLNIKKGQFICFCRDITQRKRAEKEISGMASILDLAPSAIAIHDEEGRFLYTNQRYLQWHGYTSEELRQLSIHDLNVPESRKLFEERIDKIKNEGEAAFEAKHYRKDGSILPLMIYVRTIEWQGKTAMLNIGTDLTEQKAAESALKESEAKYRRIAENISDVVWTAGLNFKTTFISPSIEKLTGEKSEEYIKRKIEEWYPPKSLKKIQSIFNEELEREKDPKVDKNRSRIVELQQYHTNGTLLWVSNNVSFIRDEKGNAIGLQGVTRDITERKKAELELKQSNQKSEAILETLPDIMFVFSRDGVFLDYYAGKTVDILMPPEHFLNRKDRDVLPGYLAEVNQHTLKKLFKTGKSQNYSYTLEMNGKTMYFDARMVKLDEKRALSIVRNITDQKVAESALKESEERFQLSMEATNDGLWDWNVETDKAYFSPAYYTMLGYKPGSFEASGKSWSERLHPADKDNTVKEVQRCIDGEIDKFEIEFRFKTKDGKWKWMLGRAKSVQRNQSGKATRIVGTHVDITDRKKTEEALRQSEATIRKKLKAILEPEGDIETLNLTDIVDTDELQTMMEDLFKTTNVGGAILDISGKILVSTTMEDICAKFHRAHPDTSKNCRESDLALASGVPAGTFKAYRCKNNMWDLVSPIEIGGKHMGNIYIGQFFYEDEHVDYELFRKQARQHGFDETEYMAALDRVPRLNRETVASAISFYARFAGMISSLSYSKIKLSRDIAQRKKAEQALQEKNDLLQRVFDSNFDLVALTDLKGNFTLVGKSHEILGYEIEYLIGKNVMDFVHPDDAAFVSKEFAHFLKTGEDRKVEYRYKRIDGTYLWFETIGTILKDEKGNPEQILFNTRNITDRKNAEMIKQLQYNIARATITTKNLSELFDSIQNELNSMIDARNFVIASYNEETGMLSSLVDKDEKDEISEWPAEKSLTGYVIEKNRPVLVRKNEIKQMYKEGTIELIGTTAQAWLGVPLKVENKILGVVVVQNYHDPEVYDQTSIEIMELVAHELSMFVDRQRSNEKVGKLSRTVEQSSVSVVITNREGAIEYVNPYFTELTGYSYEEAMGKNPNILKSGHHSESFYKELWDTILSGNDWEGELLNKKKNGELYWEKAVISSIVNNEGVITNFVGIKEDITGRKQAEKMLQEQNEIIQAQNEEYESINEELRQTNEELFEAKEKAEVSDRLKSAFLANMSHEIRTPMNSILGFSSLLEKNNLSEKAKKHYIRIIQTSGKNLVQIVNDVIDIAMIESGQLKISKSEVSLNQLFYDLYEIFIEKIKTDNLNIKLNLKIPDGEYTLVTDELRVKQILSNFLSNAIKFTEKGEIELGFRGVKNNKVKMYVKDTGIGIPKDKLETIFERFRQADDSATRKYGGTGLGLAISKNLVELLNSKIGVKSEINKGSEFYFTLPDFSV